MLTTRKVRSAKVRHNAKVYADRSNRFGDMPVFNFPQWRPSASLEFKKLKILTACPYPSEGHNASPYQILCRSVKPFWRYGRFRFFMKAAVRHLVFLTSENVNYTYRSEGQSASKRQSLCTSVEPFSSCGLF